MIVCVAYTPTKINNYITDHHSFSSGKITITSERKYHSMLWLDGSPTTCKSMCVCGGGGGGGGR